MSCQRFSFFSLDLQKSSAFFRSCFKLVLYTLWILKVKSTNKSWNGSDPYLTWQCLEFLAWYQYHDTTRPPMSNPCQLSVSVDCVQKLLALSFVNRGKFHLASWHPVEASLENLSDWFTAVCQCKQMVKGGKGKEFSQLLTANRGHFCQQPKSCK